MDIGYKGDENYIGTVDKQDNAELSINNDDDDDDNDDDEYKEKDHNAADDLNKTRDD